MRPSWSEIWFEVARTVSKRSTCPRLHVGAVIVDQYQQIVSTGYNGATRGEPHCEDIGCTIEDNHCTRAVHAEINALIQAGKNSVMGTLYCTHKPCTRCRAAIINAGIAYVRYEEEY